MFCDFYLWAAGIFRGFCRRIFSPHFCGKKCPEKSSRKIPGKILQILYNKNPRHISANEDAFYALNSYRVNHHFLDGESMLTRGQVRPLRGGGQKSAISRCAVSTGGSAYWIFCKFMCKKYVCAFLASYRAPQNLEKVAKSQWRTIASNLGAWKMTSTSTEDAEITRKFSTSIW